MLQWSKLFPDGRVLFYEGDDPKGFRAEMRTKFGFDPAAPCKGVLGGEEFRRFNKRHDYQFFCPANVLDKVYGKKGYMLGS